MIRVGKRIKANDKYSSPSLLQQSRKVYFVSFEYTTVRLFCVRADTPVLTIWQIVCTHMFRSHCLVFVLFVVGFTRLGWQTYEVVLNLTRFAAKAKPYTKPHWGNKQSA